MLPAEVHPDKCCAEYEERATVAFRVVRAEKCRRRLQEWDPYTAVLSFLSLQAQKITEGMLGALFLFTVSRVMEFPTLCAM